MLRLIQIEWYKLVHYKSSKKLTILYFITLFALSFLLTRDFGFVDGLTLNFKDLGALSFPLVWHFMTWLAAIGKIFLAIIIITMITNEFSNRTLKQNLIDGLSKKEFLNSKLLLITLFSITSTVVVFIISFGMGILYTEGEFDLFKEVEYLAYYFLKLMTFFSFCMLLSLLIRKSAFALLGFFIWWLVESMLSSFEALIRIFVFKESKQFVSDTLISNYLPLNCMSKLIEIPIFRLEVIKNIMGKQNMFDYGTHWGYVIACILYFFLFVGASYWLLKKRDL